MATYTREAEVTQPRQGHTTQKIGYMLFDMQVRAAKNEKKMMSLSGNKRTLRGSRPRLTKI